MFKECLLCQAIVFTCWPFSGKMYNAKLEWIVVEWNSKTCQVKKTLLCPSPRPLHPLCLSCMHVHMLVNMLSPVGWKKKTGPKLPKGYYSLWWYYSHFLTTGWTVAPGFAHSTWQYCIGYTLYWVYPKKSIGITWLLCWVFLPILLASTKETSFLISLLKAKRNQCSHDGVCVCMRACVCLWCLGCKHVSW